MWEIFSVFTFCNQEIALERVEICNLEEGVIVSKELGSFNINKCHCYDPNEEYRLRVILHKIGIDSRLKPCMKSLAEVAKQREDSAEAWKRFIGYFGAGDVKHATEERKTKSQEV